MLKVKVKASDLVLNFDDNYNLLSLNLTNETSDRKLHPGTSVA